MKKRFIGVVLLLVLCWITGCSVIPTPDVGTPSATVSTPTPVVTPVPTPTPTPTPDPVLVFMDGMTLKEKVCQLFIVSPEALTESTTATSLTQEMRDNYALYPVGGVTLFAKNIIDPSQVTRFNEDFTDLGDIPMFISVDEEGGVVARIANNKNFNVTKYKNAASVGSTGDTKNALQMGSAIGGYLKKYGFNLNFAPVADVNTNPRNPIIGTRAFSNDPLVVAQMVSAVTQGFNSQGIIATYKHFPGHGDTKEDSHEGIAVSYKTADEMLNCEWLPFMEAKAGDMVMVGHVATPNINGDMIPATMSYNMVTTVLRGQLGFEGIVITDALDMGAITNNYTSAEAAVNVIKAGCDILLLPANHVGAIEGVISAVENGDISIERIDESVYRILKLKMEYGILN
ncbi:MAG: glycoside hydrolase family 3 protein [Clostridiales bacterium]|nr:glycoside hydrolase family 3 protein [Clostridiales bacterium]